MRIDPADAEAVVRVAEADFGEAQAGLREAERSQILAVDDLAAAEAQRDLRAAALERQQNLSLRGVGSASAVEGNGFGPCLGWSVGPVQTTIFGGCRSCR